LRRPPNFMYPSLGKRKVVTMFCAEWALVKFSLDKATVIPLLCKCWHCDTCRPGRTRRLVEEAKTGAPTLFITLTSRRRASLTADQAAQALVMCWRKIRREYVKEHGKGSLPFLCVFEATKKGWPHIHIVARAKWLSQKWLKKRMAELHNSPHVDVRRVHGVSKVASYISKYISKNPHRFAGVKRYWRSLDYLLPPPETPYDPWDDVPWWRVDRRQWYCVVSDLIRDGWRVDCEWSQYPKHLYQQRE